MESLDFLFNYSRDYEVAQNFGKKLFPFLLILAGAMKSYQISRRPKTNTKAALGLMFVFLAWSILQFHDLVSDFLTLPLSTLWIAAAVSGFFILLSFLLAVLGLIEIAASKGFYVQGRKQAWWAMILSLFLIGAFSYGFYSGLEKRKDIPKEWLAQQPKEKELVYEKLNFKFQVPPGPWVEIDAKKVNPDATLGFVRTRPQAIFLLIAEDMGSIQERITVDALVELAKGRLKSVSNGYTLIEEVTYRNGGLEGVRIISRVRMAEKDFLFINWICIVGSNAYQLVTYSEENKISEAQIRKEAEAMLKRFSLLQSIEQEKPVVKEVLPSDHESSRYGYVVRSSSLWRPWEDARLRFPGADMGFISRSGDYAVVRPFYFFGREVPMDLLVYVFQKKYCEESPDEIGITRNEQGDIGFECHEKNTFSDGQTMALKKSDRALFITVTTYNGIPEKKQELFDDFTRLVETQDKEVFVSDLTSQEITFHEDLLNFIGQQYYNAARYEESLSFYRTAFEIGESNPDILSNVIDAYRALNRNQEAFDYLAKYSGGFPGNQKLLLQQQVLRHKLRTAHP